MSVGVVALFVGATADPAGSVPPVEHPGQGTPCDGTTGNPCCDNSGVGNPSGQTPGNSQECRSGGDTTTTTASGGGTTTTTSSGGGTTTTTSSGGGTTTTTAAGGGTTTTTAAGGDTTTTTASGGDTTTTTAAGGDTTTTAPAGDDDDDAGSVVDRPRTGSAPTPSEVLDRVETRGDDSRPGAQADPGADPGADPEVLGVVAERAGGGNERPRSAPPEELAFTGGPSAAVLSASGLALVAVGLLLVGWSALDRRRAGAVVPPPGS